MTERKLRLLVIDDEEIVCKRLKGALEKEGYEVEVFEDSQAALIRYDECPFDVVISDIRMDGMDGMQVLDHIQQASSKTKVILITGYATLEIARAALAKGAFDCIAKPFKPAELRAAIEKAVKIL